MKFSTIMKGPRKCIATVKIMIDQWLFSLAQRETYRYSQGVSKAYLSAGGGNFFLHHSLRVMGKDAQPVVVTLQDEPLRWKITKRFN